MEIVHKADSYAIMGESPDVSEARRAEDHATARCFLSEAAT
jgi:hypothetical protein